MNENEKDRRRRAAGVFEGMIRPWLDEAKGRPSGYRNMDRDDDEGLSEAIDELSERGLLTWNGPELEGFLPSERACEIWRGELDLGDVLDIDMSELRPSGIEPLAGRLLHALAIFTQKSGDPQRGRHNLPGKSIRRELATRHGVLATPGEINDAIDLLENSGYVKTHKALGTAPYAFRGVEPTPRGRLEVEKMRERSKTAPEPPKHQGTKIFIGHGHSQLWRVLKDLLQDELQLEWAEFNRQSAAGYSTKERIEEMLDSAAFAFLVMTAEEETADGARRTRPNVIHEAGLFQGRLGFKRAVVLLEDGCENFSNIDGLTLIQFPQGRIEAAFEDVRRVLRREGLLT